MTIPTMIYGGVLAFLVATAAHFIDRALRSLGKPTRWVWLGGMVAAGLAPFLPRLFTASVPEVHTGGFARPVELLYEVGTVGATATGRSQPFLPSIDTTVAVLWIVGSVLVFLVFAAGGLRLHRQRRRWESSTVGGEEVLVSDGLGPAVMGLFRPRIILPRWILALPKRDLEIVLLHEQEHQEGRDPAILAVGLLFSAISPWNPILWWALKRLRLAVDVDCDVRVLARGVSAKSYASLLLHVATRSERVPALAPALTEKGKRPLEKRLQNIRARIGKRSAWTAAWTATAGVALLVLACETPLPTELPTLAFFSATAAERFPRISLQTTHARLTVAADSGWITRQQVDGIREGGIWTPTEKPPPLDSGGMLWVLQDYRQNYLSREFEAFASALEGRVRAGGLNLDQARTAQEAYSTLIASERARVDRMIEGVEGTYERREQLAEFRTQLTSAIEAGEITEAQARARWEEFVERIGGGR